MSNILSSLKSIKTDKSTRRVGRGPGSTKGKTSSRGHKGYKARTGSTSRLKFEGGQTSITARIPKLKGFKNINTVHYKVVNVGDIEKLSEKGVLSKKILRKAGVMRKGYKMKVLGQGEISSAVRVLTDSFSESAKQKIEKAGGSIEIIKEKKQ